MMNHEIGLKYEDVYLIPRLGTVSSRSLTNPSITLGDFKFKLPVVPANMKTIVDINTCKFLAKQNMFYIMHRFGVDVVDFCTNMIREGLYTSISVGVGEDSIIAISKLNKAKIFPDFITIDIAHGHSYNMKDMLAYIKSTFPDSFIIAGNVVTSQAVYDLEEWGADAVKVGIGQGMVCSTKDTTGFTVPQFTAVLEAASRARKPIIADGGIRSIGDISKAIVAGASMVMAGSLFSGYDQSPNLSKNSEGKFVYFGSASAENKGEHKYVEGISIEVDYKGDMSKLIYDIEAGITSAISYAGGHSLDALKLVNFGIYSR